MEWEKKVVVILLDNLISELDMTSNLNIALHGYANATGFPPFLLNFWKYVRTYVAYFLIDFFSRCVVKNNGLAGDNIRPSESRWLI